MILFVFANCFFAYAQDKSKLDASKFYVLYAEIHVGYGLFNLFMMM